MIGEFVKKAGDIYVWLYEEQYNEIEGKYINKCIISGKKLQRPEQNKLGLRMKFYFFSDKTSSFLNEPKGEESLKIKLKIGTITDNKILSSIKKGERDGLSKLLKYAKDAESPIYTGTIKLGDFEPSITGNMNLVNKNYYYVYATLDDEDGTYYPIEDVSLYQALVDSKVGNNLFDYLDDNFKWNINDDEPNKPTDKKEEPDVEDDTAAPGKIPQTGANAVVIISMIGIAIIATIIGAKQYKKYNIKY